MIELSAFAISFSVVIFGLTSIVVAYCSYSAVCDRDLGIAAIAINMQNTMIFLQLVTAGYINQKGLAWHWILGHLVENNRTLRYFAGTVFFIHTFCWVLSYRLCGHLISEEEQKPDHNAKELQVAKWNQYLNLSILMIGLVIGLLIKTDIIHL
ncbi:uncharacterized protein LOC129580252 [Sitodiplosis mosellana]|uniref:uncharacterized protein LOC129580252 n=1 Tax=Sitodiplosis mosellana TaxID=263140 RepID=UPI002444D151|nr:uncharacterized protein LOC129580252 [Sitodiplosis mosellana]